MPIAEADIFPGCAVRHIHQPQNIGLLTGNVMRGLVLMVEVRWANEKMFVPLSAVEPFDATEDISFEGMVRRSRYERIECLWTLMTFEKLSGSFSNIMYSMQTAEIQFFAHQFVPVLKFVNSPLSRLLIADEVGLGKTIEAGLIWTECRARFQARRLLVICPPSLVPKWIRELQERFSIEAEFADAELLFEKFKKFKKQGTSQTFALVTSYPALRPRRSEKKLLQPWLGGQEAPGTFVGSENLDDWKPRPALLRSLLEWDEAPFIDLAVFDEAHLMKNTATASHLIGDVIATSAQSVLALSATPLATKNRDLYALLKLIDPDMFRDEASFNSLLKRNRPAVQLAREVSKPQVDVQRCLDVLEEMPDSIARTNLIQSLGRIGQATSLNDDHRIELQSKAGRLNELGSYLTRTRKVEIPEHKAVREAVTLTVNPTQEEMVFYNAVLRLIRQRVKDRGDSLSLFHLIGPALAMTSCLPVMAEKLRTGTTRLGDMEDLAALDDIYIDEEVDSDFVGEDRETLFDDLSWLSDYDFSETDSKYLALKNHLLEQCGEDKVIIFAFFKATLRYLKERLEANGIRCLLVTGDIKDTKTRDQLLLNFKEDQYRILLCSEVAAEGVDLQFCRIMVNYDLPWNPMRVEQRIGRIDRIGQQAQSIVIVNFHVLGTIDGSIYSHLYQNIGIFNETIGDLEGIIGSQVNELTKALLTDELSPEEVEEKIRLSATAIALERARVANIDEESETLLGLRSYLQENVSQGRSLGRYIKPKELRLFVSSFFQNSFTGNESCILNWDTPVKDCVHFKMSFRALTDFQDYLESNSLPWPQGFNRNERLVTLTFDPVIHETFRMIHRELVLVNHLHSFVCWMVASYQHRREVWHPASALRLETDLVPAGIYFYMIARLTLKHPALNREELLFRMANTATDEGLSMRTSEMLMNLAVEEGTSWICPQGFPDFSSSLQETWNRLSGDCVERQMTFQEELELRLDSKRAQIQAHFERRIEAASRRLDTMRRSTQTRRRGIQITERQIEHLGSRLKEELRKIEGDADVSPEFKRVACGIINIQSIK